MNKIKWSIDHSGGIYPHECYIEGSLNGTTFFLNTRKDYWGIFMRYHKWCIKQKFKALHND